MKKEILEILGGHFDVDEKALKTYFGIAAVRLGPDKAEFQQQIKDILQNSHHELEQVLLGKEGEKWLSELKLLDTQNRKHALEHMDMPEAYRTYLSLLTEEIENPKLNSPTLALQAAEHDLFEDFADRKFEENDYSSLQGLDKSVLRLILQEWLLYPELLGNREDLDLILYMLQFTGLDI